MTEFSVRHCAIFSKQKISTINFHVISIFMLLECPSVCIPHQLPAQWAVIIICEHLSVNFCSFVLLGCPVPKIKPFLTSTRFPCITHSQIRSEIFHRNKKKPLRSAWSMHWYCDEVPLQGIKSGRANKLREGNFRHPLNQVSFLESGTLLLHGGTDSPLEKA